MRLTFFTVSHLDGSQPWINLPARCSLPRPILAVAHGFESLDRQAAEPEVYFVKVDVNGTLLRLVAAWTDAVSDDRLAQKTLARAAQVVHRASL